MDNINRQLFNENHINKKQFEYLEKIRTRKLVSLYYDLRSLLYLGIMLFVGGIGYFTYENIGEIGHFLSMGLLFVSILAGFYFITKYAKPFSYHEVVVEQAYFDYILILVSLLIISLFTYIQIYFDIVELLIKWASFVSAALFLFMAYRYDNRAILSMGITALAAAIGLSISLGDWVNGGGFSSAKLFNTNIVLGATLIIIGQISDTKNIKKHFRSTYQHFGIILFYAGCIVAMFESRYEIPYVLLLLVSAGYISYMAWKRKEFLFFLYSNLSGYFAFTYLLFELLSEIDKGNYWLLIYYIPFCFIAYTVFLVKKKSHFKNA